MTYITSIERISIAQTLQQSITKILQLRFNHVPPELVKQLNQIYDNARLKQLLKKASITDSISEFKQQLSQENTEAES